jgi:endonuclease/exonuclease/phosphatase family metal-dependent hydrolase
MKLFRWFGILIVVASLSSALAADGSGIRVMTFNVMCDFCGHNDEIGPLRERLPGIADTINRHSPDLVSLQELRSGHQVRRLGRLLRDHYRPLFARGVLSYADPTLLIRVSRFRVLRRGGVWLGPLAPYFSFGWAIAFPRRVEWVDLEDRVTGRRFRFAGTHFDNNEKNKFPSAKLVVERFLPSEIPLIFAGDTNLEPNLLGYETLATHFRDTFLEIRSHPYVANGPTVNSDGCDLDPHSVFPDCRIDHVLLSPGAPWQVKSWKVDVFQYRKGFVSDHRAIVVDLE